MADKEIHPYKAPATELEASFPEKLVVTRKDDKALKFIHEHGVSGPVSEGDDKRIRSRIDSHLLPMVCPN